MLGAAAERAVPLRGGDGRAEEHEDTVITRRPGAAGDASAAPARSGAPDESRYDPLPPRGRRFVRPLVTVVLVLVVVVAGLGAAYAWTRSQYYVGVAGAQVAIYRGVSDGLPLVPLSHLYEVQDLDVAALPVYYQERVRSSIEVPSLAAARDTVTELRDAVTRCDRDGAPGTSPSPSPSRSGSPRATRTPAPTVATSPAATSPASAPTSAGPAC